MLPSRKASWSTFLTTVTAALSHPATHFFADTSFLLKAGSLNLPARNVMRMWIESVGPGRFHVPAWAAHEVYRHLGKDGGQALTPMARIANEVVAKLDELRTEARRFVEDAAVSGYHEPSGGTSSNRADFLLGLDGEANRLVARAAHLKQKAASRLEETADFLAEIINRHVMLTGSYESLPTIEAEHAARLVGDHPPGQKDKKKELNKYGDLLTWREIVEQCAREPRPDCVVLLIDDNKPDWVFRPPMVVDDRDSVRAHRTVKNDGDLGFQVLLPQPLLTHELAGGHADFQLHIVNLAMFARLNADRTEMRDLAHAYSAIVVEERPTPDDAPAEIDEGEPAAQPGAAQPDFEQIIANLRDIDRAAEAIGQISPALANGTIPAPLARLAGRAVVEAAEALETTEIFGRALLSEATVHPSLHSALIEGMLLGAYLRDDGRLRARPLARLAAGLFDAASRPQAQPAVERLRGEIGKREGQVYAAAWRGRLGVAHGRRRSPRICRSRLPPRPAPAGPTGSAASRARRCSPPVPRSRPPVPSGGRSAPRARASTAGCRE